MPQKLFNNKKEFYIHPCVCEVQKDVSTLFILGETVFFFFFLRESVGYKFPDNFHLLCVLSVNIPWYASYGI